MDPSKYLAELQRLAAALQKLSPPKKPLSDNQLSEAVSKAIAEAQGFDVNGLLAALHEHARELSERVKSTVEQRRESLLNAAQAAGMPHKRFGEFDRVGPFKVSYKNIKTRLDLGSELASEFEEADGLRVFERIQGQLLTLDQQPFAREEFFRTIKAALRVARERGQERDGWVPVRSLYAYVALLRNLQFDDFVKKPTAKTFREYPTAQFVYDLARFGRKDWSCGDESLRAETPNMATVSAGKAMTLPNLEAMEKPGPQFARLRIERGGANGTDRSPGSAG